MRFVVETNLVLENAGIVYSSQSVLDLLNPEIGGMKNGGFLLISCCYSQTKKNINTYILLTDIFSCVGLILVCLVAHVFFYLLFSMHVFLV